MSCISHPLPADTQTVLKQIQKTTISFHDEDTSNRKKKGEETHAFYINFIYPKTRDGTWHKGKQDTQFLGWTESD